MPPSPEQLLGEQLVVTVVVRGANASADAVRIVNVALATAGAKDIRIERRDT